MNSFVERDKESIWHPFTPMLGVGEPICIKSASGIYLNTVDDRKIIDGISSWWVNLHGHSNSYIADAIARQANKLEHVIFADFTHEPAIDLAETLLKIVPGNLCKVFFSDNGSTAVEVAIKMALQYWYNLDKKRTRIIAIEGAYHGDTFGSMAVGARSIFSKPFDPLLFEVDFIPFPKQGNDGEVVATLSKFLEAGEVAAFIYEPLVQGASGMRMYQANILDTILFIVREKGALLIADEVFTGFGRTGELFASNYLENTPDIITLSKGITGGALPLGVSLTSEKVVDAFRSADKTKTFFHGHSYTANPLACSAANASLELLLREECQLQIMMIAEAHIEFVNKYTGHNSVLDVRSLGTILALDLKTPDHGSYLSEVRDRAYDFFMDKGVLLRPLGNVVYFLPPYVIKREELDFVYSCIGEFLDLVKI